MNIASPNTMITLRSRSPMTATGEARGEGVDWGVYDEAGDVSEGTKTSPRARYAS
ncbi:hypothetical protein K523DRAFT_358670 [Schizophyllum commune Tattone D]|nr:hypothetical protein K523DRAFT_358670 [Schizophyllum commune Tattone D]